MRFVIMADGKECRWKNYMGMPKHLVKIDGEPLICQTIRLLKLLAPKNSEIIVTSHDPRYEFEGCIRHEPQNNEIEIDRFTDELIIDNMCFLYGDTYYTNKTMKTIVETENEETLFFGNNKSIVAIKIQNAEEFKRHKLRVKRMFIEGNIGGCKGWQVYQSFTGQDLLNIPVIESRFVFVDNETTDINTPEDYERMILNV